MRELTNPPPEPAAPSTYAFVDASVATVGVPRLVILKPPAARLLPKVAVFNVGDVRVLLVNVCVSVVPTTLDPFAKPCTVAVAVDAARLVCLFASSASVALNDGQIASPSECADAVVPSAPRPPDATVTMFPDLAEHNTRSSPAVLAAIVTKKLPVAPVGQFVPSVIVIVVATLLMFADRVVGLPLTYSRLVGMVMKTFP